MKDEIQTSLIVRKEDIFSKIRRKLFMLFYPAEAKLLNMIDEIEKPKNTITGDILIPKEIKILEKKEVY